MCDECWTTTQRAASNADTALHAALTYLNSDAGKREPENIRAQVEASKNALTAVFIRRQPDTGKRATERDLFELERGRQGLLAMSATRASQGVSPRNFSADQTDIEIAIRRVRSIWESNPAQHK